MLEITVPEAEYFNDEKEEFVYVREHILRMEHSLVSLSKWESKWHKPFLSSERTPLETLDYIRCMTITQNVDPRVYGCLTRENMDEITRYISNPMTATTFGGDSVETGGPGEILTAEVIYYYMILLGIPMECQKWNLHRLFTLMRVCTIKNAPEKKMTPQELRARNKRLNDQRRAKYNTKG